jgi:hypothetical protein
MKKLFSTFAILLFISSFVSAQEIQFALYKAGDYKNAADADKAGANLSQAGATPSEWDYGKIKHASTGVRFFKFTNTGAAPLVITNAQGSCGCTVPTWPKEPIMPGQSEYIKVSYDTQRTGQFTKSVTLTTNAVAGTTSSLIIKGEVEAAVTNTAPVVKEATTTTK